jgi:hypothetical protein
LINAGRAYIGVNDMKGQGSSQEYTFCVAERELHEVFHKNENPWKPLHVERGYPITSSTVTVAAASPPKCFADFKHCSPEILNAVVDAITTVGSVPYDMDWEYVLVLCSTHARCIADAGWTKEDIREFLYANAVMPWGKYKQQYPGIQAVQPSWIGLTTDDSTSIHLVESPKNFLVIVAGGECPYSQVIRVCFKSATKEIKLPKNWAGLMQSNNNC